MQKFIFISPLKRPLSLAYLAREKSAGVASSFATNPSGLPPCVTILPPFVVENEHVNSVIFGLKVIAALFREAESSRISLRSLLVLENEDSDILVARAQYPGMIQAAIAAAYEYLPRTTRFVHTPPLGAWTPHIKLFEGVGVKPELAIRSTQNFGGVIDEDLARPLLMVKDHKKWEQCGSWSV